MASCDVIAPPEAAELLARVRADGDALTWVIFQYGNGNELEVAGQGEGGLGEFRDAFDETKRMYGMCRLSDTYDNVLTVKFLFVVWGGSKVGVIKKARMATHKGSIQLIMGQAHVTIDASEASDLADDIVMGRITDASGSGSRVLDVGAAPRGHSAPASAPATAPAASSSSGAAPTVGAAQASALPPQTTTTQKVRKPAGSCAVVGVPRSAKGEMAFVDREAVAAAIKRVRNDGDSADWMLTAYEGATNNVALVGVGDGGVEALKEHLAADNASYGIVRVNDVFDGHVTVKFVLILWIGEKIRVVRKAKIATHKGAVTEAMGQYHTDITASTLDELTEELIMGKVMDASGSAVRTLDVGAAPRGAPKARTGGSGSSGKAPSVPRSTGGELQFADKEQLVDAIKCVRNNNDSADWVLLGYEGQSNVVTLVNVGEGGIEVLKENLTADTVNYGIVRINSSYDGHATVKFVLVIWIGESVKIMRKAKIATHKGAVLEVIGQYHCDITASDLSELTHAEIVTKVEDAAGTADHVKDL